MLPEKRKKLIFTIIAIIAVIIVIIIMYNLAKFMHNRNVEEIVYDDPYPETYPYYGIYHDEDGTYRISGLNDNFEEMDLGLRLFYTVDNLSWRNNHLTFYSDAINELRYNSNEQKYYLYELDPFYSSSVDILVEQDRLIMIEGTTLSFRNIGGTENIEITSNLDSSKILYQNNKIYYTQTAGVYEYNVETGNNALIVMRGANANLQLLAINNKYLVFQGDNEYYYYNLNNASTTNISNLLTDDFEENVEFISLNNDYFVYQVTDGTQYILRIFDMELGLPLSEDFNIGSEKVAAAYNIVNNYTYAELESEDSTRYVILDIRGKNVVKELNYRYKTMIGVNNE